MLHLPSICVVILLIVVLLTCAGLLLQINSKGGLSAIVISHPHYYTTYVEWAQTFKCAVYIAQDDQEWLCRRPPHDGIINFMTGPPGETREVVPGVTAIKAGGHFPGSLLLHWEKNLWIADTIVTVPVRLFPPVLTCFGPYDPKKPISCSYTLPRSLHIPLHHGL